MVQQNVYSERTETKLHPHQNQRENSRGQQTTQRAVKYRIQQVIKLLYKKKQHLNQQLHQQHMEGAAALNGMWKHALASINNTINQIMESRYQSMNTKVINLIKKQETPQTHITHSRIKPPISAQPKVINLTNTKFTQEQMKILNLGPQYALEQKPSTYINELIIETENAIKKLEPKWQNKYRHQAALRIKQIKGNDKQNPLHKWQQNLINIIKEKLYNENITIAKPDKSKAIVIIHKNEPTRKNNKLLTS